MNRDRDREWSLDSQGGSRASEATSDGKDWRARGRERLDDARDTIAEKLRGEKWSGRH